MTRDMELVIAILKHLEGRQEIGVIEEARLMGTTVVLSHTTCGGCSRQDCLMRKRSSPRRLRAGSYACFRSASRGLGTNS
jgi:hypothetical protein